MASKNKLSSVISDDENEADDIIIIHDDSDLIIDSEESTPEPETVLKPLYSNRVLAPVKDDTEMWWEKLTENVPQEQQCKLSKCPFAPSGHRAHPLFQRLYSILEKRMIIKYLIYYNDISNGKGLRVWEDMHVRGYMLHRTIHSLSNNFKRCLLRDIKIYNLPKELEEKFLELRR